MRAYHQIYDNDHYNRYYPMVSDPNTLPSGYGAIPYSHGFVRNKLTPKPWGVKLPAVYTRDANAGGYFNAEADTDLYQFVSTGIGITETYQIGDGYTVGNPFNFGPVSISYDITVTGIQNWIYPGNSGCNFCQHFNGDYRVFLNTAYTPHPEGQFNSNLLWSNITYCKPDSTPRGAICRARSTDHVEFLYPSLLLAEMTDTVSGTNKIPNIVLSFSLQPNNDTLSLLNTNVLPGSVINAFNQYTTPFIFTKNFGPFDFPFHPQSGYHNKPHMLDDDIILPAYTGLPLCLSTTSRTYCQNQVNFHPYVSLNQNFGCDFTNAYCTVKPHKTSFYDPKEALLATNNRFDLSMDKARNSYRNFDAAGFFPFYPFSGITPLSYDLYLNVNNNGIVSGEPFCDTCNNYFYKRRTAAKTYLSDTVSAIGFSPITNTYFSDLASGVNGNRFITDSGFALETYNWLGYSSSPFQDIHIANNPFNLLNSNFINSQSRIKSFFPNLLGICEFGCDEDNLLRTAETGYLTNYCNNILQLDIVNKFYSISSGTITSLPFSLYKSWTDAYIYFGHAKPNGVNVNVPYTINYPYRLSKRLCDDRTGIPQNCLQLTASGSSLGSGQGLLNPSIAFSGGWTYERWSNNEYEPQTHAVSIMDVSGLCNMANSDAYVMPNYHTNRSQCQGKYPCSICSDTRIPTSVTMKIDGNGKSDIFVMRTRTPNFNYFDSELGANDPGFIPFPLDFPSFTHVQDHCLWTYPSNGLAAVPGNNAGICSPIGTMQFYGAMAGIYYDEQIGPGVRDRSIFNYSVQMTSGTSNILNGNSFVCTNVDNPGGRSCDNTIWSANGSITVPHKAMFNPNVDCSSPIAVSGVLANFCCDIPLFFGSTTCTGLAMDVTITFTFGDFVSYDTVM